jgi:hypothetical protein
MPSSPDYRPVGQSVSIDATTIHITLVDGRTLDVPVAHWPFLMQATSEQRQHWQFEPGNEIIYWPDLDEGLEIGHLLGLTIA